MKRIAIFALGILIVGGLICSVLSSCSIPGFSQQPGNCFGPPTPQTAQAHADATRAALHPQTP